MWRLILALPTALALCAAPAGAATIRVDSQTDPQLGTTSKQVIFSAAPGEANRVTAAQDANRQWIVRDDGAPLTAGTGCTAVDSNSARCTGDLMTALQIDTGDRNDTVRIPDTQSFGVVVDAGDGNDIVQGHGVLNGGAGSDGLAGSPLSDSLNGGPDADVLRGGDGNDILSGDGSGLGGERLVTVGSNDVLDGGAGNDAASYAQRPGPVTVDLAAGLGGGLGERDTLAGIEGATGGSGNDALAGDAGRNSLEGGAGDDVVVGLAGDDVLKGGSGIDRLDGGDGADQIEARDARDQASGGPGNDRLDAGRSATLDAGPGNDRILMTGNPLRLTCGSGTDTVEDSTLRGFRLDGCERFVDRSVKAHVKARRSGGVISITVSCSPPSSSSQTACVGGVAMTFRRPGAAALSLGKATFDLRTRRSKTVKLRLSARERRLLSRVSHPLLQLHIVGHEKFPTIVHPSGRGGTYDASWRVHI